MPIDVSAIDPLAFSCVYPQADFGVQPIHAGSEFIGTFRALCRLRSGSLRNYLVQLTAAARPGRPTVSPEAFGCYPVLAMLLRFPLRDRFAGESLATNLVMNAQRQGFHAAPETWWAEELTWVLRPLRTAISAAGAEAPEGRVMDLLRLLSEIPARTFPAGAPPVRWLDGGWVTVDFVSATAMLATALQRPPAGGTAANASSLRFEEQIQSIVDASPWRPSDGLRALRGRTLRVNGVDVTDVDAVGQYGKTLLLLDAKARSPRPELWRGDYGAIRADIDHTRASLENWSRVIQTLRASPSGDNFDFAEFESIEGSVCYPYLAFSTAPQATARLRHVDLPMLTFPEEIRDALSRS